MTNLKKRWTEICFAYFIYDIQQQLNNYPIVMEYVELLADLAQMDRSLALKAVQAVSGMNVVRPSKAEFIYLAKHFKMSDRAICKRLHISNSTYAYNKKQIMESEEFYIRPQADDEVISIMDSLLRIHQKVKGFGIDYD